MNDLLGYAFLQNLSAHELNICWKIEIVEIVRSNFIKNLIFDCSCLVISDMNSRGKNCMKTGTTKRKIQTLDSLYCEIILVCMSKIIWTNILFLVSLGKLVKIWIHHARWETFQTFWSIKMSFSVVKMFSSSKSCILLFEILNRFSSSKKGTWEHVIILQALFVCTFHGFLVVHECFFAQITDI